MKCKVIMIILLLIGCSVVRAVQDEENPTEKLYILRCAGCHGVDGHPAKPNLPNIPNFTDPKFQKSRTDKKLKESIEDGIRPMMPGFKSKLKEEEIKALIAYVRDLAKKKDE